MAYKYLIRGTTDKAEEITSSVPLREGEQLRLKGGTFQINKVRHVMATLCEKDKITTHATQWMELSISKL